MTTKTPGKIKPKRTLPLQDKDLGSVLRCAFFKRCLTPGKISIFGSLVLSLLLLIPAVAHATCAWTGPYTDVPPPLVTSTTGAAVTQAQFDALVPPADVFNNCGSYIQKMAVRYSLGTVITPGFAGYTWHSPSINIPSFNTTPPNTPYASFEALLASPYGALLNLTGAQPGAVSGYTTTPVATTLSPGAWYELAGPPEAQIADIIFVNPQDPNDPRGPPMTVSNWVSGIVGTIGSGHYSCLDGCGYLFSYITISATWYLTVTTTSTYLPINTNTNTYTLSLNNLKSKVEPSGTAAGDINSFSGASVSVVNAQTGQPYGGAKVRIRVGVTAKSGGHDHDDALRHKGTLSSLTDCIEDGVADTIVCTTEANGNADFTFFAPEASGTYTITAACESPTCIAPVSGDIKVQVDGLEPMPSSNFYVFVGAVAGLHTDNHYLAPKAMAVADKLAILYHAKFPVAPLLHYNDTSLHFGGVLDICTGQETIPGCSSQCQLQPNGISYTCSWSAPHKEHRRGSVVDVRANNDVQTAIPAANFQDFKKIARSLGADPGNAPHSPNSPTNRHWHVRLLGVKE